MTDNSLDSSSSDLDPAEHAASPNHAQNTPEMIASAARLALNELTARRARFFSHPRFARSKAATLKSATALTLAAAAPTQALLNKALIQACERSDMERALSLIERGADVNWQADSARCPVFKAALALSAPLLDLLFAQGARYPVGTDLIGRLEAQERSPNPERARLLYSVTAALARQKDFSLSPSETSLLSRWGGLRPALLLAVLESACLAPALRALPDQTLGSAGAFLAIDSGAFDLAQRLLARAPSRPWTLLPLADRPLGPLHSATRRDHPEALLFLMENGFADSLAACQWRVETLVEIPFFRGSEARAPTLKTVSFLSWCLLQKADRCAHALALVPALAHPLKHPSADDLSLIFSLNLSNEQVLVLITAGFDAKSLNPDGSQEPWIQRLCHTQTYSAPPVAGIEALLRRDLSLIDQRNAKGERFLEHVASAHAALAPLSPLIGLELRFSVFIDKINIRAGMGSKRGSKSKNAGRL